MKFKTLLWNAYKMIKACKDRKILNLKMNRSLVREKLILIFKNRVILIGGIEKLLVITML